MVTDEGAMQRKIIEYLPQQAVLPDLSPDCIHILWISRAGSGGESLLKDITHPSQKILRPF